MSQQTIALSYTGASSGAAPWLNLEQQPVATNRLSASDLQQILAMVLNGISARAYLPGNCPASISDGAINMQLVVWAWPSTLDLAYTLNSSLGEFAGRVTIAQEREFNLEINFAERVELPFYCTDLSWEWTNIPCFDRMGNEAERPELRATTTAILSPGDIYTVIRIRCLAHGYAHPLSIGFGKGLSSISDIDATAQAIWEHEGEIQSTKLDLSLPACAEQLLATCADGSSIREQTYSSTSEDERIPVLYYNGCNGRPIVVRYE